jgi:dTDP-4-amino-4,6-dideoxygalactose transaminase
MWERYNDAFADLEVRGSLRRPIVPAHCTHNAHMYYLLVPSLEIRQRVLATLKAAGVGAIFHYVPLHSAPAGQKYGRTHGTLGVTDAIGDRLVRLPMWPGLEPFLDEVIDSVQRAIEH